MWRNYLLIALRSLAKNRLFTALNLVGLAVGMASCLLIAMWVNNETTYDQWLKDADRVFAIQATTQYPGRDREVWAGSSAMLLPALRQDFPQIEAGTRMIRTERAFRVGAKIESQPVMLVDADFFDVFALPLTDGLVAKALKTPDQIAISERTAIKWFGATSAVGQTVTVTVKGEKRPFQIAAVLRNLPSNTILEFDVLMLFSEKDLANPQQTLQWGNFGSHTFVKLKNASDAQAIQDSADAFIAKHSPPFLKVEDGFYYRPSPQNITQTHLQSSLVNGYFRPAGDIRLVTALGATGLLILLIATITYINLATARISLRAREVGLRKTLGASRYQLMAQFLVESCLLALLAGVFALALVELALPAFNALLAEKLVLKYNGSLLAALAAMVALVGIVGGWYPALVLTRLRPREAISGQHGAPGGARLRQLLVVGQFCVAVLLMTCMAIIYLQVSYLRKADMGYAPEGLIVIGQLHRTEVKPMQKNLLDALKRVPGVQSVTRSAFDPTSGGLWRQQAFLPGVPDSQAPQISVQPVDWDYLATYGARLIAGRDLNQQYGNDDWPRDLVPGELEKRGANVLVNRSALKIFNTSNAKAVIGQSFQINAKEDAPRMALTVVGVIEDLRLRSARDEAIPSYYFRDVGMITSAAVRFKGVAPAVMTDRLESAWKQLFPDSPFAAKLVDESIHNYYQTEARRGNLFALFAGIAIVLCAIGLYGLAVFTAERRTKEIGIRKVLGASVWDIVKLLVWQFSKPVMVATMLAWPVAWWLMRDWLNGFNVRIELTPLPFVVVGVLAMLIAWATVAWHATRVARTSPIHALRYE